MTAVASPGRRRTHEGGLDGVAVALASLVRLCFNARRLLRMPALMTTDGPGGTCTELPQLVTLIRGPGDRVSAEWLIEATFLRSISALPALFVVDIENLNMTVDEHRGASRPGQRDIRARSLTRAIDRAAAGHTHPV